jgi:hypothetical protein
MRWLKRESRRLRDGEMGESVACYLSLCTDEWRLAGQGWAGLAFEQRVDVFAGSQSRAQERRRGDAKKPNPDQQIGSDN